MHKSKHSDIELCISAMYLYFLFKIQKWYHVFLAKYYKYFDKKVFKILFKILFARVFCKSIIKYLSQSIFPITGHVSKTVNI